MTSAVVNLITGINRSGKTLFALQHIEKLRKETGRPVYYFGIPGIKEAGVLTDWQEIQTFKRDDPEFNNLKNPDQVHDLPHGAIIVIDEAHRIFPVGKSNAVPPPHVQRFDMAGHSGHTFFLITQDSQEIHHSIRRRVGKHHHLVRVWGMDRATRQEWDRAANPRSKTDQAEMQAHEFNYPKEVYGWYRSADNHQIKKSVPWQKFIPLAVAPFALLGVGWFGYSSLYSSSGTEEATEQAAQPQEAVEASPVLDPKVEGPAWAAKHQERVSGFPQSAQMYDALYQPKALPRISGCLEIQTDTFYRCTCHTQQASRISTITDAQCRYYIANGWFDPTKPDDGASQAVNAAQPAAPVLPIGS